MNFKLTYIFFRFYLHILAAREGRDYYKLRHRSVADDSFFDSTSSAFTYVLLTDKPMQVNTW